MCVSPGMNQSVVDLKRVPARKRWARLWLVRRHCGQTTRTKHLGQQWSIVGDEDKEPEDVLPTLCRVVVSNDFPIHRSSRGKLYQFFAPSFGWTPFDVRVTYTAFHMDYPRRSVLDQTWCSPNMTPLRVGGFHHGGEQKDGEIGRPWAVLRYPDLLPLRSLHWRSVFR